jgi:hypothetical protein
MLWYRHSPVHHHRYRPKGLVALPLTADDVAGLKDLVIEVEGGDNIKIDLHGLWIPLAPSPSPLQSVQKLFAVPIPSTPASSNPKKRQAIQGYRLLTEERCVKNAPNWASLSYTMKPYGSQQRMLCDLCHSKVCYTYCITP